MSLFRRLAEGPAGLSSKVLQNFQSLERYSTLLTIWLVTNNLILYSEVVSFITECHTEHNFNWVNNSFP